MNSIAIQLLGTGFAVALITQIGSLIQRRMDHNQTDAEVRRVKSEAARNDAEAAHVLTSTVLDLVESMKRELSEAKRESADIRRNAEATRDALTQARAEIEVMRSMAKDHQDWDLDMLVRLDSCGIRVSDPPPLFL